uniref:ATPase F1/V1/A1 complex alpha/beta subunit nucleotide-binding domain-containing protein n=1 Tax=Chromera velia CCMP2878 TaxID=1169474 RepID=A0A0G4I118_9ALVE|mmetsp:Transcript_35059/g.69190  ORF Transcript_35059/g.69190 Transcript_35059/m.69190 type:complete len:656 (-) Transcript_35059:66-2033(-)|eukprot:Cvel_1661.t1-p1 / transcript=Cvel_1661.t1 / gene=Cvel_1661 / organism=Chromera_velia_CCMP2878 / gene_product=ATP synthase subunit alpha 2, putative / transcript_product=ATP synthase subunit alpha 2, putative / location=Cvel_scaffold59:148891-154412(+) / protein_length=655 / sequence_SO=supercontig / SO=protein_coding / is_pseudo=false
MRRLGRIPTVWGGCRRLVLWQRHERPFVLQRLLSTLSSANEISPERQAIRGLRSLFLEGTGEGEHNGRVLQTDGILCHVSGLRSARVGSLVKFENGRLGVVLSLLSQSASVGLVDGFSEKAGALREGPLVFEGGDGKGELGAGSRSFSPMMTPNIGMAVHTVGLLDAKMGCSAVQREATGKIFDIGALINSLNESLPAQQLRDTTPSTDISAGRLFCVPTPPPPPLLSPVRQQMLTGMTAIDAVSPIAFGHRVLVLGSRASGRDELLGRLLRSAAEAGGGKEGFPQTILLLSLTDASEVNSGLGPSLAGPSGVLPKGVTVIRCSPLLPPAARYAAVFAFLNLVEECAQEGRRVVAAIDDASEIVAVTSQLQSALRTGGGEGALPVGGSQLCAAVLNMAGRLKAGGDLTTILGANTQPEGVDGLLSTSDIERSLVPSGDVVLRCSTERRTLGAFPPLDLESVPSPAPSVSSVCPSIRLLCKELRERLRLLKEREERAALQRGLKIHEEIWEEEDRRSLASLPMLLSQAKDVRFSPAEQIILGRAFLLFFFVGTSPTQERTVDFQRHVLATFSERFPDIFASVEALVSQEMLELGGDGRRGAGDGSGKDGKNREGALALRREHDQRDARAREVFKQIDDALLWMKGSHELIRPTNVA